jgi:hypothetical protein
MSLSLLTDDLYHSHDGFSAPDPIKVFFNCPSKNRKLAAVLDGGITLSAKSNWQGYFSAIPSVLGMVDGAAQLFKGMSISQPWFGRKYWKGTDPMSFTVKVQFVSFKDAKEEVYEPVMTLMSFLYPQLMGDGSANDPNTIYIKEFRTATTTSPVIGADGKPVMGLDGNPVTKTVTTQVSVPVDTKNQRANLISLCKVPGPTLFFNGGSNSVASGINMDAGSPVSISLGKFFNFNGCYITSVTTVIGNSFNAEGYPHSASATVTFEAMDVSYVGSDGTFAGFTDTNFVVPKWLDKIRNFAQNWADQLSTGVGKVVNEIGRTLDILSGSGGGIGN